MPILSLCKPACAPPACACPACAPRAGKPHADRRAGKHTQADTNAYLPRSEPRSANEANDTNEKFLSLTLNLQSKKTRVSISLCQPMYR